MDKTVKNRLLLISSSVLLLLGSTLLVQQTHSLLSTSASLQQPTQVIANNFQGRVSDLQGFYPVESVTTYTVQQNGKDAFSFLFTHYQDQQHTKHQALLFPATEKNSDIALNPIALRQSIWQEAATAIKAHSPANSLFLSWWDDGQRIHFLSGHDAWLSKPGSPTLTHPIWKELQKKLLLANNEEQTALTQMAQWLTMDSAQALAKIRQFFGTSCPIYLLVTNDLLAKNRELANYHGNFLHLQSTTIPSHDNLHSDISQIRQWAQEQGNGNYLVQKEGDHYRAWVIAQNAPTTENSLLVRLLPFVNSLKTLPKGVQLVYQSRWGSYLSIYKID